MAPPDVRWHSCQSDPNAGVLVLIAGVGTSSRILFQRIIASAAPHTSVVSFEHPRDDRYSAWHSGTDRHFDHNQYASAVYAEVKNQLLAGAQVTLLVESAAVMTALAFLEICRQHGYDRQVKLVACSPLTGGRIIRDPPVKPAFLRWLLFRLLPYLAALPYWLARRVTQRLVTGEHLHDADPTRLGRHQYYIDGTPMRVKRAQIKGALRWDPHWLCPGRFGGTPLRIFEAQREPIDLDRFTTAESATALCRVLDVDPADVVTYITGGVHSGFCEAPEFWDPPVWAALQDLNAVPATAGLVSPGAPALD